MGVEMMWCSSVLVSVVLYHVCSAAPGCELEQIFETPRKDYDKLEIMERSNFDAGDSSSSSNAAPVAAPLVGTAEMPRSFANAQIMLRFGGGGGGSQNERNPEPKTCSCGRFCQCGRTPYPMHHAPFPGVYYVMPHSVPQHVPQYSSVPQHVPQYSPVPQHVPQYSPVPQHVSQYSPVPHHVPQYSPVPQHVPHYAPVPHIPSYGMPYYAPYMPVPQYTPHYLPQLPYLPQIEHPVSLPDVRASKPQQQPTMIIIAKQRVLQKPPSSSSTTEPSVIGSSEPSEDNNNRPISNNHPEILQPIELSSDDVRTDKVTNEMIEEQIQKLAQKELAQKLQQEQEVAQKLQREQELAQKLEQEQERARKLQREQEELQQQELLQKLQEDQVRRVIAQKLQGIPPAQSHVKFVPMNFPGNSPSRNLPNPKIEAAVNQALIPYMLKHQQKPKLMVGYPIFNNEVPEVPRNLFVKTDTVQPQFQYSGYKITSGSGYYEDPYQRVVYNPPALMSVMKAHTLDSRHNFDCDCASCAKYTRELNE